MKVPVYEPGGHTAGRVREVAFCPQDDPSHVSALVVRTKDGDRLLGLSQIESINGGIKTRTEPSQWPPFVGSEGMILLTRDLLDQQIIDVHGRKVVRVNDVDLSDEAANGHVALRVSSVDVGARGAVRRLLHGVVPLGALRSLLGRIPQRNIPWEFVDLIETDPA
ncbi:MAG: magnesium transporter, partial [Terriglobales bacterium]